MSKKQAFLDVILQPILRYAPSHGLFPSMVLTQCALESGWGQSTIAREAKNWFGIKAQAGYTGKKGLYYTKEQGNVTLVGTKAWFREYDSPAQSVIDHAKFLQKPSYADVLNAPSPEDALWRVWKAGYATDKDYYTKVIGTLNSNNFKQYDGMAPTDEDPTVKPFEHWAEQHFKSLNAKGITMHSKLFDEDLKRGDSFIMCDRAKNHFHKRG